MKKLTKKHIISIAIVVVLIVTVTGIALGTKGNKKNKEADKKVESVEKEKEEIEEEEAEVEENAEASEEPGEGVENTEDNTQSEAPENTQSENTKNTMYEKSSENVHSGAGTSNSSTGNANNNNSNGNSNGNTNNNANAGSMTPSTPTHEHIWKLVVRERYDYIKTYVNGCNGCGYPLFTITENGTQNIENLYFHPACYSEKLGSDCTGGGFHNESYTSGYCSYCGGKVSYRQCMWTEMGKLCCKNEALGPYKKVFFDQNHFMYLNVCDCGKNLIVEDESGKGIIGISYVCTICGETREEE